MQLDLDVREPVQQTAALAAPSHPWILGLVADEVESRSAPGRAGYSFVAECECPDDCPRDHGNE